MIEKDLLLTEEGLAKELLEISISKLVLKSYFNFFKYKKLTKNIKIKHKIFSIYI